MKDFKIEIQIEFTTQKISINYLAISMKCCIFAHSQSHRLWRGGYRPTRYCTSKRNGASTNVGAPFI